MQPATVILALFAATGFAAPADVEPRQLGVAPSPNSPFAQAQAAQRLQDLRNDSIAQIRNGGGKGRRLGESGPCGPLCKQCRSGAIGQAVSEIAICGSAALGAAAVSGPLLIFAEVTLFLGCESHAINGLNKAEAECAAMGAL